MTSLADLLFEPQTDAAAELAAALGRSTTVLRGLSVAGITRPDIEVANAIAALLEMPVGNLAIKSWSDHRSIAEARSRTAEDPTTREVVRLLEHKIETTQEPEITAEVNGATVTLLTLTLEVEMRLSSADLVVERGKVVDIRPGSAVAKATLSASKVELAKKEYRQVDLRQEIEEVDLDWLASLPPPKLPPLAPPAPPPPKPPPPTPSPPAPTPGPRPATGSLRQ